ncbi:MAG: pseudaminic acid synthase [Lachnospiraceae bacterium]|nr:pseudaminic acid synthase [Lachnospiraceae bacterium]
MSSSLNINGRMVGDGSPAYIIAEMSANHAGSMERALELIHAAKEAGADCVKIQTYTPDTMTIDCSNEYFQIEKGTWEGENLYSLYQKAYTPWEWQARLRDEAAKVGIDFLSTPFDKTSVDFLEELGVSFYKVASFELVDIPLLEYIASRNKPVIMSTAMGTLEEINEAVDAIYSTGNRQLALMKCSSAYPAKSEEMNLGTIRDLKARFDIPVGLSDHSMGSFSAATAVALGANIIEKHFCISRAIKNPDSGFSMEPDEFRDMVNQVREVERAIGTVTYGVSAQEESNACFRRSLFAVKDIAAGDALTPENVRSIRPAYGLKPKYYKEVLGRTAKRDLKRGTPLTFDAIDGMEAFES